MKAARRNNLEKNRPAILFTQICENCNKEFEMAIQFPYCSSTCLTDKMYKDHRRSEERFSIVCSDYLTPEEKRQRLERINSDR